jgi:hypothetical protein
MDASDYPQDERHGATGKVPSLLHDYRAQRDAWREQARNLARMREEVLSAADHEAKEIVTTARTDIRSILLKARRDLLVLAAQVRAAGRLGDAEDTPDGAFLPADELGQAGTSLTTARHDIRRVLDESRPELEGLVSEGEALRAALRQQRLPAPTPIQQRRPFVEAPIQDIARSEPTIDFEFTTIAAEQPVDFAIRNRPPARAFIAAVATLGGLALMGTTWWLFGSQSTTGKPNTVESKTSAVTAPASGSKRLESSTNSFRSPLPDARSPVSIGLAARRTAWIRITADGRVTAERTFKAGETQLISASREVSIRAGDAGAVTVSVGGRQPVAFGREGEVLTRKFTADTPRVERTAPERPITPRPSPQVPIAQAAPQRPPVAPVVPSPSMSASNSSRLTTQQPITPPAPTPIPPTQPASGANAAPSTAIAAARPAAAAPPAPSSTPATQSSINETLTSAASRWLDAYYRQDRATMASISPQVNVADDRGDKDRLPRGLTGVRRTLEDVNVQVFSSEAMLTAKMTERMENAAAGQSAQSVAYVSHMWTRRNGTWQLYDVRIVSSSTLTGRLR